MFNKTKFSASSCSLSESDVFSRLRCLEHDKDKQLLKRRSKKRCYKVHSLKQHLCLLSICEMSYLPRIIMIWTLSLWPPCSEVHTLHDEQETVTSGIAPENRELQHCGGGRGPTTTHYTENPVSNWIKIISLIHGWRVLCAHFWELFL